MPNTKTGGSRWVPDIRPENIDTYTETDGDQSEEYKIVDAHPIIGGVLDKMAFFRTHAAAVWYDRLRRKTIKDKIDEIDKNISDKFNFFPILNQGTYNVGTEYTPVNDPREYNYFFGYISWIDVPVLKKQWYDGENWHVNMFSIVIRSDRVYFMKADMLINNTTGNVMFREFQHAYIDSSGFHYDTPAELTGVAIY